ncbi:MAG: dipeptidase [Candidatus Aminicenantes bacterium]|nr:dipeptidase [Candidatus Aminicenantes bacterium]
MKTFKGILIFSIACLAFAGSCSTQQPIDIHQNAITLDTHVDIGGNYATAEVDPGIDNPNLRCDLTKMENGGMDGVFLAAYVGNRDDLSAEASQKAHESVMNKIEAIHRLAEQMYPNRCELAVTPDDVERIVKTGKQAIMIGIENGFSIGENLPLVEQYYDLGVRYITLCHSSHNQICDSSGPQEPLHNGISDFGKKVVGEMNRLGIMCDVSHIAEKSFWDLIELSKAPIMATHSGCAELNPHNRNLTDEQLKALAEKGGVVQIVALGSFLKAETPEHQKAIADLRTELELPSRREMFQMSEEEREALRPKQEEYEKRLGEIEKIYPPTSLKDMVDHIDHAVKIAGIDHVGIGTDFDGGGGIPGFNNHAEARNVTDELIKRGYSAEDISKIWGGNLLRVWRDVAKVATEIQN